ncbi:MAG: PilT/PilU family type 4a pilus ATPase [Elusimicrobia bacterium]|nr:PilT/PilU family type 4a pilus ATPase [Elusimicrobiota bacterium]
MELQDYLNALVTQEASDLHLRAGGNAVLRVDGKLKPIPNVTLTPKETQAIAWGLMNEVQRQAFSERHEADLAYSVSGIGRFRVNIYQQRGTINIAFRRVPTEVASFETLKLPAVIERLAEHQRGLILVTGHAGCGKSTTLAAMIDYINTNRSCHIVTIEDPIEFLHRDKQSIVSQRELGLDTLNYVEALKHVVRQDPDVILIGEMRDLETMAAALTAAQTGHLVLSTIHTIDAVQTVSRIVDLFPPHQQPQIRFQLADTLRGVISQRLLPHASGQGRVPAVEVLVVTELVKKHIQDSTLGEVSTAMRQGAYYGMQTYHQALIQLFKAGEANLEDILFAASNPEEIMMEVRGVKSGTDATTFFEGGQTP